MCRASGTDAIACPYSRLSDTGDRMATKAKEGHVGNGGSDAAPGLDAEMSYLVLGGVSQVSKSEEAWSLLPRARQCHSVRRRSSVPSFCRQSAPSAYATPSSKRTP